MMTDIQGYDYIVVKAAAKEIKEHITHLETEVWINDVYTYDAQNDFCRDWLPFMTELGYTCVNLGDISDMEQIKANCEKWIKEHPVRPTVQESSGLKERNAFWVRNDAMDNLTFPDTLVVQKFIPGFTEEDYATCFPKNEEKKEE